MDDTERIAEAERLARDCVLLKRFGSEDRLAGVWGGPGIVPAPDGPFRHWISIDCRFLPIGLGPSVGVMSVYTNVQDCVSGLVAYDSTASLVVSGEPALYAWPARSIPPPDAMSDGDDETYLRSWQGNCPLYTGEAAAVLGGWHFPWPDGDWEDLRDQPLLVWTLDESEPWVEVWGGTAGFRVIQRIT